MFDQMTIFLAYQPSLEKTQTSEIPGSDRFVLHAAESSGAVSRS
jgi:hypothetical protein